MMMTDTDNDPTEFWPTLLPSAKFEENNVEVMAVLTRLKVFTQRFQTNGRRELTANKKLQKDEISLLRRKLHSKYRIAAFAE